MCASIYVPVPIMLCALLNKWDHELHIRCHVPSENDQNYSLRLDLVIVKPQQPFSYSDVSCPGLFLLKIIFPKLKVKLCMKSKVLVNSGV